MITSENKSNVTISEIGSSFFGAEEVNRTNKEILKHNHTLLTMNSRRFTSAETIPNSNSTRNPNILESNDDIDQELLLKRHIATHAMECTLDELGETNHNILFPQNSEPDISPITNTTSFTFPKIVQYMEIIKGTRRETPNVKKIKIFVDTLGPYMKLKP